MNNISWCLVVLLCVTLLLSSCSFSNQTGQTASDTTVILNPENTGNAYSGIYAEYFDYDYLHKPTNESVKSITRGMTMPEVIEIIGKPHSPGPLSGVFSLEWKTEEGYTCMITCAFTEDALDDIPDNMHTIEAMMKYGVASTIHLWEENPFGT